jgi:hypothetical protein
MTDQQPGRRRIDNSVALWAGIVAFFTNLVALKIGALIIHNAKTSIQIIGALTTSLCIAISVYAKQRLDDAKEYQRRCENSENKKE